ncbi:metallophosphoesterase family protein [Rhodoferax sp.]|uniref:metallophosphoesterase family protein n=1 Tax=Rhodoferax sp. TaxID=50421 RepID=UPI00374D3A75
MTLLLQISDTHFGTEQAPVVEALAALVAQQRPDLLVLSGDITQRARPAQFRAARAFVDRLDAPLLAVPGNHDIPLFDLWARWKHPYALHRAAFGAELEPTFSSPALQVIGVNTTRAYRHADGAVSAAQIDRVARLLASAQDAQLRVVVVHQPIAVLRPEDVKNRLQGHAEAQRVWAAAGADVVLGGHIHLPYVAALPGLARPMWAVQAGTAVSSRLRAGVPNSVNLLRWSAADARCQVEQWDFAAAHSAFACVKVTALQVARGPYAH